MEEPCIKCLFDLFNKSEIYNQTETFVNYLDLIKLIFEDNENNLKKFYNAKIIKNIIYHLNNKNVEEKIIKSCKNFYFRILECDINLLSCKEVKI